MASMTDFLQTDLIQESAVPTELEKTDEELAMTIVESYLTMSAAFANVEKAFECASICAFCEAAEIEKPDNATVVVETFWDSVKNVFETVVDWFRSIISGFIGLFTSAKLQKLIAKLKTKSDLTFKVDSDIYTMIMASNYVFEKLEEFKRNVVDETAKPENIRALREELEKVASIKNWSKGVVDKLDFISDTTKDLTKGILKENDTDSFSVSEIVEVLEKINKCDFPKRGSALLKNLKFDESKYKKTDADGNETGEIDKDTVNDIKKCARLLAKLYDKITTGLVKVSDFAFRNESNGDEAEYKENLEKAKQENKEKVAYNKDDESSNRIHAAESAVETPAITDEYFGN